MTAMTISPIPVRSFLNATSKELLDNLTGTIPVLFDDGQVVNMRDKEICVSRYAWELWKYYPKTPLTSQVRASKYFTKGYLSNNTHVGMIRDSYRSIVGTYISRGMDFYSIMEDLWLKCLRQINAYYNDLVVYSEEYVQSFDVLDMIEIADHPVIREAVLSAPLTQEGVDHVYNTAKKIIESDELRHNPLARAITAGFVKVQQALQVLTVRGFLTDVNSRIYQKPIMTGFLYGTTVMADLCMESRSGTKALANSESPLQSSEYFARRMHHVVSVVANLHPGDCGSQMYFPWYVRDEKIKDTGEKIDSDLVGLEGKFYMDHATGQLNIVSRHDTHLIGQTIDLRSPCYPGGCLVPRTDPNGICEVCFGAQALSVPRHTNLGMYSSSVTAAEMGQKILSVKHYDGSSVVEGISLNGLMSRLLWAESNGKDYFLNKSIMESNAKVSFTLAPNEVRGITDINNASSVNILDITRISAFKNVCMHLVDEDGIDSVYNLELTLNTRQPSMTRELLQHIRDHGYTVTSAGHYSFDLTGWDCELPLFSLPMRHFNMSDHQKAVEAAIGGDAVPASEGIEAEEIAAVGGIPKRKPRRSPSVDLPLEAQLIALYDLIFGKLGTKLCTIEVIFLSLLASAREDHPHELYSASPIPGTGTVTSKRRLREAYAVGSASTQMAFQEQAGAVFKTPDSLLNPLEGRYPSDHFLDWMLNPHEVWQAAQSA